MTHHLSTLQVQQLCVSALPEDELVAAAVHTTECQSCHDRFVEELKRQRGSTPLNFSLEPEFWFQHDHVDFEQLVALCDKTLDQDTEEIINIHLKTCESCREDVRSFLAFRNTTAREKNVTFGPIDYKPTHDVSTRAWWQRLRTRPVYAVAAIVFVAMAILIGVIALNRKKLDVSQTEMARLLDLDVAYTAVSGYELGTRQPDLLVLLNTLASQESQPMCSSMTS